MLYGVTYSMMSWRMWRLDEFQRGGPVDTACGERRRKRVAMSGSHKFTIVCSVIPSLVYRRQARTSGGLPLLLMAP